MHEMTSSKILIIDDSLAFGEPTPVLKDVILTLKNNYSNVITSTEADSWLHLQKGVDLIFLEYSVTNMKGILFLKKLASHATFSLIPTIFISKTKAYDHRVNAFEIGAADFLPRPFEDSLLLDMTRSQLENRRRIFANGSVKVGNMLFEPPSRSVTIETSKIRLTELEFKILQYLLVTPKNVITRDEICESVWGDSRASSGRLDTQLYNLKKKIVAFNGKIKSVNKIGMRVLAGETTFYQEDKKPALRSLPPLLHL